MRRDPTNTCVKPVVPLRWTYCRLCRQEFRREPGWAIRTGFGWGKFPPPPSFFTGTVCAVCVSTREAALELARTGRVVGVNRAAPNPPPKAV